MMLKYSDVYAALYRVTAVYSPLFRTSSVRTRYVWHGVFQDSAHIFDVFSVETYSTYSDSSGCSDFFFLGVRPHYFDEAPASDFIEVLAVARLGDAVLSIDSQSFSVSSRALDSSQVSDSFYSEVGLYFADFVGVNDEFYFGGDFNTAVGNASFASDSMYVGGLATYKELLYVSDHVRVGSRLRHGLYIGGAALGVAAIGGRLK